MGQLWLDVKEGEAIEVGGAHIRAAEIRKGRIRFCIQAPDEIEIIYWRTCKRCFVRYNHRHRHVCGADG